MQSEILNIADSQTTITSQVLAIEMFRGFSNGLLDADVHYNKVDAKFIADRYYSVLINILE